MRTSTFLQLGRRILIATQLWLCSAFVFTAVLAIRELATGTRLRFAEPWDSMLFYPVFVPSVLIILSWMMFCLVGCRELRRRGLASSLSQLAFILKVVVPVWGVGYYDRVVQTLLSQSPQL